MRRLRLSAYGVRDAVLFITGLVLFVREAVFLTGPERPTFLLAYLGMMGLAGFLPADERRAKKQEPDQRSPREAER